jgi:hypothetical protein
LTIQSQYWEDISGAGSQDYTAPGDLDWQGVNGWWALNGSDPANAMIAVYVDDGRGARQMPFTRQVSYTYGGTYYSGQVEFRYQFDTDPNYAQWLDPVAALRSGTWNTNYMANTYLPSLKFRVVVIPP